MKQVWVQIRGWSNYEVSNQGRVRRRPHYDKLGRFWRQRTLSQTLSKHNGYQLQLQNNGVSRQVVVVRLMLTAFVRLPEPREVARHLDDNKKNQTLINLAWGTPHDNAQDAKKNGRLLRGSKHKLSKLTECNVSQIKSLYVFRSREFGIYGLARMFNVDPTTIWAIVRRGGWAHVA